MPSSVTIQQSAQERGRGRKRFGVDHEVCVFVGASADAKIRKRNSVSLNVRKLAYASPAAGPAPPPCSEVSRSFLFSKGSLRLTVSLASAMVFHGERVRIAVKVDNQSGKSVKGVSIKSKQALQSPVCLPVPFFFPPPLALSIGHSGCHVPHSIYLFVVRQLASLQVKGRLSMMTKCTIASLNSR